MKKLTNSISQLHRETLADTVVRSKFSLSIDCQLVQATELESTYWLEELWRIIDVIVFLSTGGLDMTKLSGHDEIIFFVS